MKESTDMGQPTAETVYETGMRIRRQVLGDEYVDRVTAESGMASAPLQELVASYCWGAVWSRDELPLQTRSLLNIALLTALDAQDELALHTRGAINNGCTPEQVHEVVLQAAVYCGIPAALAASRTIRRVLDSAEPDATLTGRVQ
jgi:4-carboxymuconolactone decarboxylase